MTLSFRACSWRSEHGCVFRFTGQNMQVHGVRYNHQLEEFKEIVNGVQLIILAGSWNNGAKRLRVLIGHHIGQRLNLCDVRLENVQIYKLGVRI